MRAAASSIASGRPRAGDDPLAIAWLRRYEREIGSLRTRAQREQFDAFGFDREGLDGSTSSPGMRSRSRLVTRNAASARVEPAADGRFGVLDDLLEIVEHHQASSAVAIACPSCIAGSL